MKNYKLNVQNGKVEYLMRSGKDVVKSVTTEDTALWMLKNKDVAEETIDGYPEYGIKAGEFYFSGVVDDDQKPKIVDRKRKSIFKETKGAENGRAER